MTTDAATHLAARLSGEPPDVRRALTIVGELLTGATSASSTANGFLEEHLRQPQTSLVVERVDLSATRAVSVGAALADLVAAHGAVLGPAQESRAPTWARIDLEGEQLSVPSSAAAHFPAGTAVSADVVVQLVQNLYGPTPSTLRVVARPEDHAGAQAVSDALLHAARHERAVYRGRVLHASSRQHLHLQPTTLAPGTREDLVLPAPVWAEVDASVSAMTTRAPLMRELGLGTSRGILLAGPPGVGKSALSRAVAREMAGDFTVLLVDSTAASTALRDVYRETADLGPSVIILEDVDLYLGDRKTGARGPALADFLAVLDGTEPHADVLTIASTNDPAALDAAAVRSARFDTVIHLDPPDRAACAAILDRYLGPLAAGVDTAAVAAALPHGVTGADLREVVRRSVLEHGRELSTERLRDVVAGGRWKPAPLSGSYL